MKKLLFAMIAVAALCSFAACSDSETYADLRNRERDSINAFLRNENIKVITEAQFKERFDKGMTLTDTAKANNEYVLFESNGIYMQVIDQGCGDYIKQGETTDVLVRFSEYNLKTEARISTTSLQLSNNVVGYSYLPDKMSVTNTSGTFTGAFDTSSSLMAKAYGYSSTSAAVPSGWLTPFTWVKIGRPQTASEKIAHVRILVPHTYGTSAASGSVYACLYDMTLQRGR